MPLSIGFGFLGGLLLVALPTWLRQPPVGVRSQVRFIGNVMIQAEGKQQSVPVSDRTWTMAPGATIEDLRLGASGNLVVEVQSGILTTTINGQKQTRRLGEFFVVPADQKAALTTAGDRSAIIHTLLLPAR